MFLPAPKQERQRGHADQQQAGSPQEGQQFIAMESGCLPQFEPFIHVPFDRRLAGIQRGSGLAAPAHVVQKGERGEDGPGPEKTITELGGSFPTEYQADDRNNESGDERKKEGVDQDAQDRIFHAFYFGTPSNQRCPVLLRMAICLPSGEIAMLAGTSPAS